ncbi:MAG: hypothetical protein K0S65_3412 [Labilithrix sp.]|nr:hypothetical protein [Labilithrix sp.]
MRSLRRIRYLASAVSLSTAALLASCSSDSDGQPSRPGLPEAGIPDGSPPTPAGWDPRFGLPGIAGTGHTVVNASAKIAEDQLVITGSFAQAGAALAPHVALWNGKEWKAIGQGLSESLDRLAATPSGELFGSVVHVTPGSGLETSKLYKWNRTSWTEAATFDGRITDIDVDSRGTLHVAGSFTTVSTGTESRAIANIARYDGTTWSDLGEAPANAAVVRAIDGKIYVGGPIPDVAVQVYDGTTWTRLPFGNEGAYGNVSAVAVQDGELVVAGRFRLDGASPGGSVARWNGSSWGLVGGGVQLSLGFGAYDIGDIKDVLVDGSKIYVTGLFVLAGDTSVANVAAFDSATSTWSAMEGGISGNSGGVPLDTMPFGYTLTAAGGSIYVGGGFSVGGSRAAVGVARWDGSEWSALDDQKLERIGVNGDFVETIAEGTDGAIYVGGAFSFTGRDVRTSGIARFANGAWAPLGAGLDGRVLAIATDETSVYAGGTFAQSGTVVTPYVARWDGSAWSAVGEGLDGNVRVLVRGPDGKIYAGGAFATSGRTTLNSVGVWDGSRWSALGTGLDGTVDALAFDDAGKLYAGGMFRHAGGKDASAVALWDGSSWSAVGQGLNGGVRSLVVYDGKVTAGGTFRLVGDKEDGPYTNLAAWDGSSSWNAVGGGTHGPSDIPTSIGSVASLSVREGKLYVGGEFAEVGDGRAVARLPVKFLAQWDGKSWSKLGDDPLNDVVAPVLATNEALWIGGAFTLIGQLRSNLIGRYVYGTP